jgi:hypothetical protein
MIKEKEEAQTPLSYLDLHPHWHLGVTFTSRIGYGIS